MSNCCCCQVINPPAENCNPVTAAQIADLALIEGKDINNCDRYMTLDNLIDPCRLGAQVPAGVITDFVGLDMNDCLVAQSIPAVVVQGETPLTVVDTFSIDFTASGVNGHTLTGSVILSPDPGNILETRNNGMFVGETPLTVVDTASVNLGTSGLYNHTLQADVQISALPGNIISIQADGLYAAAAVETPLTATDSATVDFTTSGTSGHTLTGSVKLSATGGNQLVANADGLYVPTETTLTVADTSSVNLTAGGVRGHAVQADVKVSATAGNVLVINGDGLYVPTDPTFTATDTATINFTTSGTRGHTLTGSVKLSATAGNTLIANADGLYVPTVTETVLTANDSSSINFTTSGTSNHTLTGVVKLSATAGNSVVINADGIYVPTVTQTALTANDSSTVNFTTSGTDNHTLTADVKVSATAGNEIIVNADGLYVATPVFVETNLTGVDTATVDLQTSGTAQHTLQANVKISASANNQVVAHGDGLFVGVTAQTPITVTDTPSVDLTASGTDNHTIKADVKLSATTCNAIVENADGLFVMDTFSMTLTSAPLPGAGTYNAATIAGWGLGTRSLGTGTITWTNPYCRPARVLAWLRVPNTTMQMGPGNYWISGVGPSGGANLSNVSAHSFGESVQMSWGASHIFLSQTTVPVGGTFNLTVEREVQILAFVNSGFEAITLGSSGVLLMIVPD